MIFEKFFRKINMTKGIFLINFEDKNIQPEDRFFSDIHLYDDLKQLLRRMIVSRESVALRTSRASCIRKIIVLAIDSKEYEGRIFY